MRREESTWDNGHAEFFRQVLSEWLAARPVSPGDPFSNIDEGVISFSEDKLEIISYGHYAVKTAESAATFWLTQALGSLALLYVKLGALENAHAAIERAHIYNPEHLLGFYTNYIPMAECELLLARQEYPQVLSTVEDILAAPEGKNARGILPYSLYYRGKALQGLRPP